MVMLNSETVVFGAFCYHIWLKLIKACMRMLRPSSAQVFAETKDFHGLKRIKKSYFF